MAYKLYGFPNSRTSRVIWTFWELGIDYEFIHTQPRSDIAYSVNPAGKLPVLAINELPIIDSTAICMYLADTHFNKHLTYPPGTIERAKMDSWIQFAINDLEAPLWLIAKHEFVLAQKNRVPEILKQCKHEWETALDVMEKRLGDNHYVMGDNFSIADVILGQIGGRWATRRSMEIKSDSLNQYFQRVCQRSAIANAINYEQKLVQSQ